METKTIQAVPVFEGAFDEHYKGDVEPIELMQAQMSHEAFMGFLRGNIIKYTSRLGKKDDVAKETFKILKYAEWLHRVAQSKKVVTY